MLERKLLEFLYLIFVQNLGTTASVVGAALTVYFSWGASNAASQARKAALETRNHATRLDILQELASSSRLADDLGRRIDGRSWEMVVERSSTIRTIIAPILVADRIEFSPFVKDRLSDLIVQMKSLSQIASSLQHGSKKEPSLARLQGIVGDQKETLTLAISEVRTMIGVTNA